MRRTVLMITLLISLATTSFAEDQIRPYVSIETGYSWTQMNSGGFNALGPHENTSDDTGSSILFGAKAGLKYKRFSSDISFTYRDSFDFKTDSYAPPTPTFFYETEITIYNVMLSGYYDLFSYRKFAFFAGSGIGVSFIDIETDDTIVSGDDNANEFAWQAEVGIEYAITSHLSVTTAYRYIDLGEANIDLFSKSTTTT